MTHPAPDYLWPEYNNDMLANCVPDAIAHVIQVQRGGKPVPDASVQSAFKRWCGSGGCNTGLTMWEFYVSGLDGYRCASFGMLAKSQAAHMAAIDKYQGFIAGLSGGHQVAAVGYDDDGVWFVSDGKLNKYSWRMWLGVVDRDTFAFSDKFDLSLIFSALRTNWIWRVYAALGIGIGLYAAGVI